MSTPEEGKKIPEFFIFDRVDELEKISLELLEKTESVEPELKKTNATAKDGLFIAVFAYTYAFISIVNQYPHLARKLKDNMLGHLKNVGLSAEGIEMVGKVMTVVCDAIEKSKDK